MTDTKRRDEEAEKRSKRQCTTGQPDLDKAISWYLKIGFEDGWDARDKALSEKVEFDLEAAHEFSKTKAISADNETLLSIMRAFVIEGARWQHSQMAVRVAKAEEELKLQDDANDILTRDLDEVRNELATLKAKAEKLVEVLNTIKSNARSAIIIMRSTDISNSAVEYGFSSLENMAEQAIEEYRNAAVDTPTNPQGNESDKEK